MPPVSYLNNSTKGTFKNTSSFESGVRLAIHTANRLIKEDGKYGLVAACAAGGQVRTAFAFFSMASSSLARSSSILFLGGFITHMPILIYPTIRVPNAGSFRHGTVCLGYSTK